mgnify:CR=1 FL=1
MTTRAIHWFKFASPQNFYGLAGRLWPWRLTVSDTPDGVTLSPYSAEFEQQMTAARRIMKKRREVLRELAK